MKEVFLNYSINKIKSQNLNFSEEKIAEIKYGLEGLYMMITKTIIIFAIAIILNIFKELLILLLFFNLLRLTGFGLHLKSSGICLISSTAVFIGLTMFSKYVVILFPIRLTICLICTLILILYAPADTQKRPLINKKKRHIYKFITVSTATIYIVLQFIIPSGVIVNSIMFSILIEAFLVNPVSYKLLGFRYKNYMYYQKDC